MGELLARVLPLALGAAISPTVLTVQLVTLSGKVAPLARAWAVTAGFLLVLAAEAAFALAFAASTGGSGTPDKTVAAVKVAAAALLLALGIRTLLRPPGPPKPPDPDAAAKGPRLPEAFGVGAVLMLTNVTSIVLFFPAVHQVGAAHVDVPEKGVALLLVMLVTSLPATGPVLAVTLLGARGRRALEALNAFTTTHRRTIAAAIAFAFAAFLGVTGLEDLL